MLKPNTALGNCVGKPVIVALKGGREYRGTLDGFDPHLNIVLKGTEIFQNGASQRRVDSIIVRGDNVIYISP